MRPATSTSARDGTVNSADVMQLIDWVGEGTTYEQLYAESPRQVRVPPTSPPTR